MSDHEVLSNGYHIDTDDEDELITPQELLNKIETAWLNEKSAPDMLQYQGEIIELMMGQLLHMDENLQALPVNDLRRVVHKMELERIKYTIAAYLRCRLHKLEDFTQYMVEEEKKRQANKKRLSEAELKFAEDYLESIEKHFQQLALQHLPPQQDDISKRIIRPNIMSHVFIKVLKSSGTIVNTSDEEVDLSQNSIHMLPYQLISELVNKEIARNGGFKLCEEEDGGDSSQIDWRFIASADIHKIIKECDYEKIDECVPFLIKSTISDLFNSKALDPVIGKIYNLSQLALEYLLFCTKFLDKSVSSLRESLYDYQKQNVELQGIIEERDLEIIQLKKNLRRIQVACDEIFPCSKCGRKFENQSLLDEHIHENHYHHHLQQPQQIKDKDSNLIKAIKLELEVKQLKEKLNLTERELMNANTTTTTEKVKTCEKCQMNMMKTFSSVGIQINSEEKERDEKEKELEYESDKFSKFNDSIRSFMSEQVEQIKQQKSSDEKRHQEEVTQLKEMLDKTIKTLKETENKQVAAPSPAPRTSISREKKSSENDGLWKIRFQELEKMYEYNQTQMAQSMKDMEQAYAEKMKKLEVSMNQLKNEKAVVKPREIMPKVHIQTKTIDDESSITDTEDKIKPQIDVQKEIKVFSGQVRNESEKPKKTFSAQKSVKSKHVVGNNDKKKTAAVALLNERMKVINLPRHSRQLTREEVERIQADLASRREATKKRCKDFYISRKNIKARVERIYMEHHCSSKENIVKNQTSAIQEVPKDRDFHEKLEKILQKKINDNDDDKPVAAPKKKVLFNLERQQKTKEEHDMRIQNEDDSDFNITSFEEDLK